MSHFTRVKTVIRDRDLLEDTLRQLHYNFRSGESVPIRGLSGTTVSGEVVIDTGCQYDIGFQRHSDGSYVVCADWMVVQGNTPIREHSFTQQLNQTYAHLAVKRQVLQEGLIIEEERVLENGEIELVVSERF